MLLFVSSLMEEGIQLLPSLWPPVAVSVPLRQHGLKTDNCFLHWLTSLAGAWDLSPPYTATLKCVPIMCGQAHILLWEETNSLTIFTRLLGMVWHVQLTSAFLSDWVLSSPLISILDIRDRVCTSTSSPVLKLLSFAFLSYQLLCSP